jgi:hypothetical protein
MKTDKIENCPKTNSKFETLKGYVNIYFKNENLKESFK